VKTKTAYREKTPVETPNLQALSDYLKPRPAETPAPNIKIDDEPIQPSETTHIEFNTDKAEPSEAVTAALVAAEQADAAKESLLRQLGHLRQSEELQRQHAQHMAQQQQSQPPTREQKLSMWIQQGLTEEDGRFLSEHPEMIDRHDLTRAASDEAEQHHERGTESHRAATLEAFRRLQGQQAQAQPAVSTPAFFQPPEPSLSPATPDRAAIYSAPVSRTTSPGGYREPSPKSVRLSPIEQEIARNLGLSDVAYAEGKLRLQRAKANGEVQS
jgi:hypothetical protein